MTLGRDPTLSLNVLAQFLCSQLAYVALDVVEDGYRQSLSPEGENTVDNSGDIIQQGKNTLKSLSTS